jgi:hypothetical protein
VDIPGVLGSHPGTASYAPTDALFEVSQPGAPIIFCDRVVTYHPSGGWEAGRRLRFCAVDRDGDQSFDAAYWCASPGGRQSFATMMSSFPAELPAPVAYQTVTGSTRLLSAGLVVTRSGLGAYRLEFAVAGQDQPHVLSDGAHAESRATQRSSSDARSAYFRALDVPLTITLLGARIEITAVTDRDVTYRILSGFDASVPIRIAYSGDLPRRY